MADVRVSQPGRLNADPTRTPIAISEENTKLKADERFRRLVNCAMTGERATNHTDIAMPRKSAKVNNGTRPVTRAPAENNRKAAMKKEINVWRTPKRRSRKPAGIVPAKVPAVDAKATCPMKASL